MKSIMMCGLMIVLTAAVIVVGAAGVRNPSIEEGWLACDRGDFDGALKIASKLKETTANKQTRLIFEVLKLEAYSSLGASRFPESESIARYALGLPESMQWSPGDRAEFLFLAAEAVRKQGRLEEAMKLVRDGRLAGGDSKLSEGLYALRLAQVFVSKQYDVSALIWLERAERLLAQIPLAQRHLLEVYRFQAFSYGAKLAYPNALAASDKLLKLAANSRFRKAYRNALYVHAGLLGGTGQTAKADKTYSLGLDTAKAAGDVALSESFLSTIALRRLMDKDPRAWEDALAMLAQLTGNSAASFENKVVKAAAYGLGGRTAESNRLFAELESGEVSNAYMLQAWQVIVADRNERPADMLEHLKKLRSASEEGNYRDDLVFIEYMTAKAMQALGLSEDAVQHADEAMKLVDEIRGQSEGEVSLDIMNSYHGAFRIKAELEILDANRAFSLAENLKGRILRDRLSGSALNTTEWITADERSRISALAVRFIENPEAEEELTTAERAFTVRTPADRTSTVSSFDLGRIEALNDVTIISYLFTTKGELVAFVWNHETGTRRVKLNLLIEEATATATKVRADIRNKVFFKRDGKALYDKLLQPLAPLKQHVVVVPDQSLWAIPFQALSPDGKSYLIEERAVTYAPSISILADQLGAAKARRQTLRAFANNKFGGRFLQFVNVEATRVANIYGSRPSFDVSIEQFRSGVAGADIIHLSMHAEGDRDRALDSYLGFRKTTVSDGRLTTENLLKLNLSKGSLVFIASCDTNSINNAEGVVSLAWGMTAAGATTVVSSSWEADDRSTADFSEGFYRAYKGGASAAESIRAASVALISDKSKAMHEPYYWAAFSLSGDFR